MVSISIVTWNSERYLDECFAALMRQDYPDLEVVIVDNASSDGTREKLRAVEGRWKVIYNDANAGFASGQNQAIREARGEWVLCLNPDVMVSPDFVSQLVRAGEAHPEVGAVCGKLLRWEATANEGSYQGTASAVPNGSGKDEGFSPSETIPQGLKPGSSASQAARLKSCPDTKPVKTNSSSEAPQELKADSSTPTAPNRRSLDSGGQNQAVSARDDKESNGPVGTAEAVAFQNLDSPTYPGGTPEGVPLQDSPADTDQRWTNIIDSTGIYFTRNMRHLDRGAEEIDHGQYDREQYVFGATGAAAMFRREFIEAVSVDGEFFDEEFFSFREDADLAWRAQVMGWKCLYTPKGVAWHVRRVTPERRRDLPLEINWHSVKNRFLMRGKNASGWLCWRLFWPVAWRDLMTVGYALVRDRRLLSAVRYPWKNRESVRRKRAMIQARRKVSDRDLLWWFCNKPRAVDTEKQ